MKKIGFIGLGSMGLPMAKRLCLSDYKVQSAVNRDKQPAEELKKCGGIIKDSFVEVVRDADIILSILPGDQELEQLLLDEQILANIQPNAILIEMTSCSPSTMQKLNAIYSERGIAVFDAPVSGGTKGAEDGTLTIMGGGSEDVLGEIRPILVEMANNIVLVGDVGAGKAIKAINQMLLSVHMVAASEAFVLGEKLGLDPDILYQVITTSSGNSTAFKNKFKNIINDKYELGFRLSLMKKDMKIAINEGNGVPLPLLNTSYQLYEMLSDQYQNVDFSVVNKLLRKDDTNGSRS